jgi:hypothetical protein
VSLGGLGSVPPDATPRGTNVRMQAEIARKTLLPVRLNFAIVGPIIGKPVVNPEATP